MDLTLGICGIHWCIGPASGVSDREKVVVREVSLAFTTIGVACECHRKLAQADSGLGWNSLSDRQELSSLTNFGVVWKFLDSASSTPGVVMHGLGNSDN